MKAAICTLFEGHYHHGLGALANSLYKHGYRGKIWAGFRGSLPPWIGTNRGSPGLQTFSLAEGCEIRFVPVETHWHLTNFKPQFMREIFAADPGADALCYFDPDIVIKCRWSFYEEWLEYGVALVQEITNSAMPANHPIRMHWMEFAKSLGLTVSRELAQYFNGGFLGLSREKVPFLTIWQSVMEGIEQSGISLAGFMPGDRSRPFLGTDQDALNIAAMCSEFPLSTIGPEGMDFIPGGFTMSHAVGGPKPWMKSFLGGALRGWRPSAADKEFWNNAAKPISLHSKPHRFLRRSELNIATLITRFYRK